MSRRTGNNAAAIQRKALLIAWGFVIGLACMAVPHRCSEIEAGAVARMGGAK